MSRLNIPRLRSGDGERGRPASFTHGRPFMVTLGLAGVLAALTLLYIGYNSPNSIPGRSYYTINAQFKNADNLTASYQVRIGGELVGQVLRPRVEHGLGVVDLQLKPEVGPLLSDTTLKVRPRSPVGVRFVELHPGTKGTPLKEGGTIPASNTSVTVQIDQALATFDADHRKKTQQLLSQLGEGFLSRGEDINAAIKAAPPTLAHLQSVAQAVNDVSTGVERNEIATGFAPEAKALRPFAAEDKALAHDLDVAPAALRSVQADLARVNPMLASLERVGANAEPTLRVALPTLQNTRGLLAEAPAGLAALPTTLGNVRTAVPPTLAVLKTLQPVLPTLDTTLKASLPLLGQLGPRDCDFRRFFGNWRDTLAYQASYSGLLRFSVEGTPETLQGYTKKIPGVTQSAYPGACAPDTQKLGTGR
jgi:ABC-type transporter Mla subunit MlaD